VRKMATTAIADKIIFIKKLPMNNKIKIFVAALFTVAAASVVSAFIVNKSFDTIKVE